MLLMCLPGSPFPVPVYCVWTMLMLESFTCSLKLLCLTESSMWWVELRVVGSTRMLIVCTLLGLWFLKSSSSISIQHPA